MSKALDLLLTTTLSTIHATRRYATARNYQTTINLFRKLMPSVVARPADCLCHSDILAFKQKLEALQDSENTICSHLRNLRAVLATFMPINNLFHGIVLSPRKTVKRSLKREQIQNLIDYQPKNASQHRAKDVFMMLFYLNGIAPIDLVFMPASALSGNNSCLSFCRHKTGVHVNAPITQKLLPLLNTYLSKDKKSRYLLLFLDSIYDEKAQQKHYDSLMRSVNHGLHTIENKLNMHHKLTAYVARHSFASMANAAGVSIDGIKTCLGHSNVGITELYIRDLDDNIERQVNDEVEKYLKRSDGESGVK